MAVTTTTPISGAASTVELFASFGVAVFPGPFGEKGTRCADWPAINCRVARELTLQKLREQAVNIVLRTGPELAAIDIDGKDGVEPAAALEQLLKILPESVAVYRTFRGFGVLFRPKRVLGDGLLPAFGAELFTAGHLVNVPPSRHPSGIDYEWVAPPGGELPVVDLEALGLTPVAAEPKILAVSRHDRSRPRKSTSTESQHEFERLMAKLGIVPRRGGRETFRCTQHDDRERSLSIDWEMCLFNDFSTGSGCILSGGGGLGALRHLLGEAKPPQLKHSSRPPVPSAPRPDFEDAQRRLAAALGEINAGSNWAALPSRREGNWHDEVLRCHKQFRVGTCGDCGRHPAFAVSCGFCLCTRCVPTRLALDWRRHQGSLPESMTLVKLVPACSGNVRQVRGRFTEWRERLHLAAGIYGVRAAMTGGVICVDVLLAIPDEEAGKLQSGRAFAIQVVATAQGPGDALAWMQNEYLEEATSWRTPEELLELLAEIKGRRRFQGFGGIYGKGDESEAQPLGRVSGGAGKGGSKRLTCPFCGGKVELFPFTVSHDMVDRAGEAYLWRGPPK